MGDATKRNNRRADLLARVLTGTAYFRGKTRLANLLGRFQSAWSGGRGTFPIARGKNFTVDLGDRIQRLMWGGVYEPHVKKCLTVLLQPGETFVDVGAHIGFLSVIAASAVGETGKVYSFEANPIVFQKLQANASEYPWLTVSWRAVWNKSEPISFSGSQQAGESGWGTVGAVRSGGRMTSVDAISLDDWHASIGSPPVRVIKIDAEGSEPFILEGARGLIASARPFLIMELNDVLLREAGRSNREVADSLREQGYRIFAFDLKSLEERGSNDPLPFEALCVPAERLEEAVSALNRIGT
jgi:FkbM family methyltransferase